MSYGVVHLVRRRVGEGFVADIKVQIIHAIHGSLLAAFQGATGDDGRHDVLGLAVPGVAHLRVARAIVDDDGRFLHR